MKRIFVLVVLLQCVCVRSERRFPTGFDRCANPASGRVDGAVSSRGFILKPTSENWPRRDLNSSLLGKSSIASEETYGFMLCTESAAGSLFLMAVYGYLLYVAASFLSDGSGLLFALMGRGGIIEGLFLPVLGAFPDAPLNLDETRRAAAASVYRRIQSACARGTKVVPLVTSILDGSTLNQKLYLAALGYTSPTFLCSLTNMVAVVMAIRFRRERFVLRLRNSRPITLIMLFLFMINIALASRAAVDITGRTSSAGAGNDPIGDKGPSNCRFVPTKCVDEDCLSCTALPHGYNCCT